MYAALADINDIYGPDNVTKWADLNNDGNAGDIADRIDKAITRAQSEVNDRLRTCRYAVPFDEPPPSAIVYITALYAGRWLYRSRGIVDVDNEDQLMWADKEFSKMVREIHGGILTLDLDSEPIEYPKVIK